MEALDNVWYGSWRPLTYLTRTFRACHLCTLNVAAIFFRGHPYIWRTTVRHDTSHLHYGYCNVLIDWVETHKCFVHSAGIKAEQWTVRLTYLAQRIPWSIRRFLQVETQALHFAELKLAISSNVGDSGAQFLVEGDCVRASPVLVWNKQTKYVKSCEYTFTQMHTHQHTHTHVKTHTCTHAHANTEVLREGNNY